MPRKTNKRVAEETKQEVGQSKKQKMEMATSELNTLDMARITGKWLNLNMLGSMNSRFQFDIYAVTFLFLSLLLHNAYIKTSYTLAFVLHLKLENLTITLTHIVTR